MTSDDYKQALEKITKAHEQNLKEYTDVLAELDKARTTIQSFQKMLGGKISTSETIQNLQLRKHFNMLFQQMENFEKGDYADSFYNKNLEFISGMRAVLTDLHKSLNIYEVEDG